MLEPTVYRQFLRGYIDRNLDFDGGNMLVLCDYPSKDDLFWLKLCYAVVKEVGCAQYLIIRKVV